MEKMIRSFGRKTINNKNDGKNDQNFRAQRARPTVLPPDLAHVSMAQVPGVACP